MRGAHDIGTLDPVVNSMAAMLAPELVDELARPVDPLTTGFDPLDDVLEGGLHPGELVVVAGRPGVGKTVALVQWARNLAKNGRRVAVASYEHNELTTMGQFVLIELGELEADPIERSTARRLLASIVAGSTPWTSGIESSPLLAQAEDQVKSYADSLHLVARAVLKLGFNGLERVVNTVDDLDVLVVDHLQKVGEADGRRGLAAELKQLAVQDDLCVVAASPITAPGMGARRLRMGDMQDASMVAHEADIVLALNDKIEAVSRAHSAFDTTKLKDYRAHVVLTVEKNRRGLADIALEFRRDFVNRRYEPAGAFVTDTLVDGLMVRE